MKKRCTCERIPDELREAIVKDLKAGDPVSITAKFNRVDVKTVVEIANQEGIARKTVVQRNKERQGTTGQRRKHKLNTGFR